MRWGLGASCFLCAERKAALPPRQRRYTLPQPDGIPRKHPVAACIPSDQVNFVMLCCLDISGHGASQFGPNVLTFGRNKQKRPTILTLCDINGPFIPK